MKNMEKSNVISLTLIVLYIMPGFAW